MFILGECYEIGGYLRWSLPSDGSFSHFFLSFVRPMMSPNIPSINTRRRARMFGHLQQRRGLSKGGNPTDLMQRPNGSL